MFAEVLGSTVVAAFAKLAARAAGSRRARVYAAIDRFGRVGSWRMLAVAVVLSVAAAGAGMAFGVGPVFVTLGLLVILLLASQLISRFCRLVAERMEEDHPELARRG